MEQIAAFNDTDGFVSLVIPSPRNYVDGVLSNEAKAQIVSQAVPAEFQANVIWVTRADIDDLAAQSGGRMLRNAWMVSGGQVQVDMPLARTIRMQQLREVRNQKLAESDGPMMKAMESGDQATIDALKAKRQALRDLPNTLDLNSIADAKILAELQPAELK